MFHQLDISLESDIHPSHSKAVNPCFIQVNALEQMFHDAVCEVHLFVIVVTEFVECAGEQSHTFAFPATVETCDLKDESLKIFSE